MSPYRSRGRYDEGDSDDHVWIRPTRGRSRRRSFDGYSDPEYDDAQRGGRGRRSTSRTVFDNLRQDFLKAIGSRWDTLPSRHSRRDSYSISPPRSRGLHRRSHSVDSHHHRDDTKKVFAAAATAGAAEAIRLRHEPGSWIGKKGARVASAALVATALDVAVDDTTGSKTNMLRRLLCGRTLGEQGSVRLPLPLATSLAGGCATACGGNNAGFDRIIL